MGNEDYNDPGASGPPPIPDYGGRVEGNAGGATYVGAQNDAPDGQAGNSVGAPDPGSPEKDEFAELSGDALDQAVADAGIDASTGGSKADGGLTADEKRDALRAKAKQDRLAAQT